MYSYNGVVLPKLPDVPKGYDNAYISLFMDYSGGDLLFSTVPLTWTANTGTNSFYATANGSIISYGLKVSSEAVNSYYPSEWEYEGESACSIDENVLFVMTAKLNWSKFDTISRKDGSVYLEGSDPIPVYE